MTWNDADSLREAVRLAAELPAGASAGRIFVAGGSTFTVRSATGVPAGQAAGCAPARFFFTTVQVDD
jgi:hypothetical protein